MRKNTRGGHYRYAEHEALWDTGGRHARAVLAGAHVAGVQVTLLEGDGLWEDDDIIPWSKLAEKYAIPPTGWEISPLEVGGARARHVVWAADCLDGTDGVQVYWLGLLHDIAHAVTAPSGSDKIGHEDAAASWEWTFCAQVWGPLSVEARLCREWSLKAGVGRSDIRVGPKPTDWEIKAARLAWYTSPSDRRGIEP